MRKDLPNQTFQPGSSAGISLHLWSRKRKKSGGSLLRLVERNPADAPVEVGSLGTISYRVMYIPDGWPWDF